MFGSASRSVAPYAPVALTRSATVHKYVRAIDASQADQLLTDRQQEVLLAAVEAGYYRAPRESTLGDVADALDIATATLATCSIELRGTSSTGSSRAHGRVTPLRQKSVLALQTHRNDGFESSRPFSR
ncbi:helix-turn-helix domain-containing protein [Halorubrum salsamenti]|uniref:helix-turn-helix domain-containing protein n=1 Tax=Halorubrum salsamenti TaxID=2583990 RepID=UPI0019D62F2F|nr:helix-turn-helix domain-containing protein [Halorubrum salsamenti]